MKTDNNALRKFGITMGVALAAITILAYLKHHRVSMPLTATSLFFFLIAYFLPFALKPIHIFWMKFAITLSWINSRIILILVFYLVFAPLGLLMRMFGKDLLERKIERSGDSYWKKKEVFLHGESPYERQF
ncbi:MAG: SxtJ family membrane protein [Candidatus Omnitrophota bacterium]